MLALDTHVFRLVCRFFTKCCLILHLLLLLLFAHYRVFPLLWLNLGLLIVYALSFLLIRRDRLVAHMMLFYAANVLFVIVSVLTLGWGCGFQLLLITLNILVFLGEYIVRTLRLHCVTALPISIALILVYLLLFYIGGDRTAPYTLPDNVCMILQFAWSAAVFAVSTVCMYYFVELTTDSERALTDQASRDRLTGLYNRAGYDRLLAGIELKTTILLLFDGDKFKSVNDTYGHETGDRILRKMARVLQQNFRSEDPVCRIGGDEFVVLMLHMDGMPDELILNKISRINRELSHIDDQLPSVSLSVGVCHGRDEESVKTLFEHADAALYEVKQRGGHGCTIYGTDKRL